ncbi:MAG: methyltransferase domain-containing protein [Pseudomonadota bacterium]
MAEKQDFARSGPVHFQSLERELLSVARYFDGAMLNAGCGNRDLGPWLAQHGVNATTNYDIASDLPGAIIGSLDALPFADATFDTILCNAVLEHVKHPEAVVAELARVLRPGGHVILAVPFLQPYHESPHDFRRYSSEGLVALGEAAGLRVVAINPVHSAAQTLGWIAWEIAKERGRLARWLTWPIVYVWTRFSTRTDPRITRNANTFQIVFTK